MYAQSRTIKLSETDATGLVYFTQIQKFAMEAFEEFLHNKSFGVLQMITNKSFLTPVVHVSVDYLTPLFVGDFISIHMTLEKIGVSSFTLKYEIKKDESDFDAAVVKITHVCVNKETRHAAPISRSFIDALKMI